MNLRPDIRLRAARNSASSLSYSSRFVANRKLVLISAITELPVGRRNVGQTKRRTWGKPRRNLSSVLARVTCLEPLLLGVSKDVSYNSSSLVLVEAMLRYRVNWLLTPLPSIVILPSCFNSNSSSELRIDKSSLSAGSCVLCTWSVAVAGVGEYWPSPLVIF